MYLKNKTMVKRSKGVRNFNRKIHYLETIKDIAET